MRARSESLSAFVSVASAHKPSKSRADMSACRTRAAQVRRRNRFQKKNLLLFISLSVAAIPGCSSRGARLPNCFGSETPFPRSTPLPGQSESGLRLRFYSPNHSCVTPALPLFETRSNHEWERSGGEEYYY